MIGDNIHYLRLKKGMTLSELARRAKISKSNLSNIERNINQNPSIKVLEKLAAVLDADLSEILGLELQEGATEPSDQSWIEFMEHLRKQGVSVENLNEYKKVLEFIEWQSQQDRKKQRNGS
ncbi:helix-turn-helix domain-containing protein [Salisediminibacterium halotolerans]|uniref:XRE family transcriptional regulator, master regulator for biofilm formation n=1 Tax=Salisediminibacterium halotolerans TaxID=517425 RepID=A0A1H9VXY3_9BACI|nr:helix-turn-helix transcriptional regulator [Salisediminibacterium haloalkalitolerans]SES26379.1 XRE family transcriptional regulator, master regulator for biofilm formation [Salisediminibacterium haloalkalitolerans]